MSLVGHSSYPSSSFSPGMVAVALSRFSDAVILVGGPPYHLTAAWSPAFAAAGMCMCRSLLKQPASVHGRAHTFAQPCVHGTSEQLCDATASWALPFHAPCDRVLIAIGRYHHISQSRESQHRSTACARHLLDPPSRITPSSLFATLLLFQISRFTNATRQFSPVSCSHSLQEAHSAVGVGPT